MERRLPVGTKSSVPRLPDSLVRRPRLDRLFDVERRRQITLVAAPPGAGKTTLLASWYVAAGGAEGGIAWLSLDASDNDASRLAGLVVAALERAGALSGFTSSLASGEVLLDAAFEHLMVGSRRHVLMIDDVDELTSPRALRVLAHLVKRAPVTLDVVLASRADPPIGWGRLLVEERLCQIRNAELRFRTSEAVELLAAHGVRLGWAEVRLLCRRTEGWVAGLRLAACALQSDVDPRRLALSASATQAAVSDYLLKEVLLRQDEAVQRFLLRTSVASWLTPDLAALLTDDQRAAERLAALERRGLFLVELDQDGSYRYHALFGALLRARLRLQDPELFTELHRRAARWHLAHGMPQQAEHHARAAGDWGLVGRLVLAGWVDAVLDGRWLGDEAVADIPASVVARTPELTVVVAADACHRNNRAEADLHWDALDRAAAGAPRHDAPGHESGGDGGGDPAAWRVARPLLDVVYGRAFGYGERARDAIVTLQAMTGVDAWGPRARRLATLRGAEADIAAGHVDHARKALGELAADRQAGWCAAEAAALVATLDAAGGDLLPAEERAVDVLARGQDAEDVSRGAVQVARIALALCRAQRDEQRGAVDALDAAEAAPGPTAYVLGSVSRVLRAALHSPAAVPVALDDPPVGEPLGRQVLVALGIVEVADARGRVHRVGGDAERALAEGRRWLAGDLPGRPPPILDLLASTGKGASPPGGGHPRTTIEAQILAAVLAADAGGDELAAHHLAAALELSRTTGIRAPFTTHSARVCPLIQRLLPNLGPCANLAVELTDRLAGPQSDGTVEPLTDREREVLYRLPTMMSNVEIARGMHVSVNTVKTHLKAVYRKLGVDGRRQAVLRGRELELI